MDCEQTPHERNSERRAGMTVKERPVQVCQGGMFTSHFSHYVFLGIFEPWRFPRISWRVLYKMLQFQVGSCYNRRFKGNSKFQLVGASDHKIYLPKIYCLLNNFNVFTTWPLRMNNSWQSYPKDWHVTYFGFKSRSDPNTVPLVK